MKKKTRDGFISPPISVVEVIKLALIRIMASSYITEPISFSIIGKYAIVNKRKQEIFETSWQTLIEVVG